MLPRSLAVETTVLTIDGRLMRQLRIDLSVRESSSPQARHPVTISSGSVSEVGFLVQQVERPTATLTRGVATMARAVPLVTGRITSIGQVVTVVGIDIALIRHVVGSPTEVALLRRSRVRSVWHV